MSALHLPRVEPPHMPATEAAIREGMRLIERKS